jgi:hypothetical protein
MSVGDWQSLDFAVVAVPGSCSWNSRRSIAITAWSAKFQWFDLFSERTNLFADGDKTIGNLSEHHFQKVRVPVRFERLTPGNRFRASQHPPMDRSSIEEADLPPCRE